MSSQEHSGENNHSSSSVICPDCGDSGFCQVAGGVVVCGCRRPRQPNQPSPSPSPAPVPGCSIPSAAAKHQLNQCKRLILFLEERGDKGATSVELVTILKILRYSSRIFTCRKTGYVIKAVDEGDNIWRYYLRYKPVVESPPYVFQQAEQTGQDRPRAPAGVTPSLFFSVPGER